MENQYNKTKENLLLLMQQLNDKANELEGIAPNEEIRRIKYNILDIKLILQNYFDDNSQIKIACKIADKYMKKCFDKFGKELNEGDYVDVQDDGIHQIYKKDNQLYFKPYGKEDKVSAYFSNDMIKIDK